MYTGSSLRHFYKQMVGDASHLENTILHYRRNMSFSVNKCYYCISSVVVNTWTPSSTTAINTMIEYTKPSSKVRIFGTQVKHEEKNDILQDSNASLGFLKQK